MLLSTTAYSRASFSESVPRAHAALITLLRLPYGLSNWHLPIRAGRSGLSGCHSHNIRNLLPDFRVNCVFFSHADFMNLNPRFSSRRFMRPSWACEINNGRVVFKYSISLSAFF